MFHYIFRNAVLITDLKLRKKYIITTLTSKLITHIYPAHIYTHTTSKLLTHVYIERARGRAHTHTDARIYTRVGNVDSCLRHLNVGHIHKCIRT